LARSVTDILVNTAHFPKTLLGEAGQRCFQIRTARVMIYGVALVIHGVGGSMTGLQNLLDLLTAS
jgi:hypothetical protein